MIIYTAFFKYDGRSLDKLRTIYIGIALPVCNPTKMKGGSLQTTAGQILSNIYIILINFYFFFSTNLLE